MLCALIRNVCELWKKLGGVFNQPWNFCVCVCVCVYVYMLEDPQGSSEEEQLVVPSCLLSQALFRPLCCCCRCSLTKSFLTPQSHGLQYIRLLCPSLFPWVYSNSYPLTRWGYLTISSSVTPFSFCLQSFPASGSFPMSQLFASGTKVLELQHQSFQ